MSKGLMPTNFNINRNHLPGMIKMGIRDYFRIKLEASWAKRS